MHFSANILLFLVLLASPTAFAERVDNYLKSELKKQNIPGLSMAVIKNGKILKAEGYGLANVELNVPATPDTVYQLASITKQFTATAILMLVEEGKLGLDDKISKHLSNAPPAWSEVTLHHLLNHTSGIKSYTSLPDFNKNPRKDYTHEELIGLISDLPLEFEPGARFRYNNSGYFLLGVIIENVTGQRYGDFLKQRIFQPLGMDQTRVNELSAIIPSRASGYASADGRLSNGEYVSPTQPFAAGALVSTVLDMAKWDAALYMDKLLSRSSLDQMWTATKLNDGSTYPYGFGWALSETKTHRYVEHGGGIPGFSTQITRFVDDGLTVVVLINQSGTANPSGLARGIAGHYIPELAPVSFPAVKKNGPGRSDQVDDYILSEMNKQNIPGLSLTVVQDGKIIKAEGYGWANVENKIPVRPETVFQLQSITKSFTATAIMMLVEEGKVGLDDRLGKYLDGLPDDWGPITVRHLLTHTSGIKDFINEPTVDLTKDISPEDVIQSLAKLPLNFPPGEKYAYSNTGYHLLGMIIHKVTGTPWPEFLRQRIFLPLQMTNTDIVSATCRLTNRANGYSWGSSGLEEGRFVAPTILGYAGGGMLSTVLDLAKWDAALYTEKVLPKSTLRQMWTPAKLNSGSKTQYGFGWAVDDYRGHKKVGHSGAHMTGFKTTIMRFLEDKLTVIVLANQRAANPENVAVGVAGLYIPSLNLAALKPKTDPDPAVTRKLKDFLFELAEKKDSPLLTPQFRDDYAQSPGRASSLAARLKAMKAFTFLACDDVAGRGLERLDVPVSRICYFKMSAVDPATAGRFYTFYLTEDGKVAYYESSTE
jgi:CubicO group peptidase (beta-lactamase class C family)